MMRQIKSSFSPSTRHAADGSGVGSCTGVGLRVVARRGFSFTELLFAVLILGIGFIMLAAVFPVGLAQTKSSFDETHAADVAKSAVATVAAFATDAAFPPTGGVVQTVQVTNDNMDIRTKAAHGGMIQPADPRYAWTMLYKRDSGKSYMQVIVLVANRSQPFSSGDLTPVNGVRYLEPRPVRISIDTNNQVIIQPLSPTPSDGNAFNHSGAAPGGYIVIGSDNSGSNDEIKTFAGQNAADQAAATGRLNGRVYKLGNQTEFAAAKPKFDLAPGSEFSESFAWDDDANPATAEKRVVIPTVKEAYGFILGRNRVGGGDEFDGPTLDVAFYTSFVTTK